MDEKRFSAYEFGSFLLNLWHDEADEIFTATGAWEEFGTDERIGALKCLNRTMARIWERIIEDRRKMEG